MKSLRWGLVSQFSGLPKLSDFKLIEETLPEPKNNEILVEAMFLSLDPYMRIFTSELKSGDTMIGEQVAKVITSRHPKYNPGDLVQGMLGWRNRSTVDPDKCGLTRSWDTGKLPKSLALSILGMQGLTAYHGLITVGQLEDGKTVFVNSSAGIVGCTVGQLAKIKGCRVIGCAGSDDKCQLVKKEFGFDACINYKTNDMGKALKVAAPKGIDFYYDNVGGSMSDEVILNHLNRSGKVISCGAISSINSEAPPTGASLYMAIISKEICIQGFTVYSHIAKDPAAIISKLKGWIEEGKIKFEENVIDGFNKMPASFIELLQGKYSGKVVIKA